MTDINRLTRLYRLNELPRFVGLRRSRIAELIEAGEFPRPIRLSDTGRAVAWLESDLIDWQWECIARRAAARAELDREAELKEAASQEASHARRSRKREG
jgi:predicted DNA-binding transcriptional regulator AlpA